MKKSPFKNQKGKTTPLQLNTILNKVQNEQNMEHQQNEILSNSDNFKFEKKNSAAINQHESNALDYKYKRSAKSSLKSNKETLSPLF